MLLPLVLIALGTSPDSLTRHGPADGGGAASDSPVVVVHRQPSIPLLALRLSIVADDPPGYAGAGHLLQHLIYPSLAEQVERIGGRVQIQRTSDAIVYSASGPVTELSYLAGVLRGALRAPRASEPELLRAVRELREERLADWETADRHVRSLMRTRLFPRDLPAAGTEAAAERLARPGALTRAWRLLYRPERTVIVAAGDVSLAEVEAAFADLPPASASGSPAALDTVPVTPLASAEATRAWLALGYPAGDLPPAALSVAARIAGDLLQADLPEAEIQPEHWWTHQGQAVVLIAAVPGPRLEPARRALESVLARARDDIASGSVREAARAIRREMLFYSRTPDRMAEVIGTFTDRSGDPEAADRFYAELDALDEDAVRDALTELLETTPALVEIPPQPLP